VLLFCLAFGCSAGCWASLIPGAAVAMGLPEEDEWSDEWDDEAFDLHDAFQASSPIRPPVRPSVRPSIHGVPRCTYTARAQCTYMHMQHATYMQHTTACACAQAPAEPAPPPPVHWPSPLELPDEIASRSRAELPEAFVCPLTMGLMRLPAITPRGTSYEYEVSKQVSSD
jgi:hypothetical protein